MFGLLKDRTLILYIIIGISGVVLDFVIYYALVRLKVPPAAATFISVSIAIINNFIWNAHYNFKRKDHIWFRFASFYVIGATGALLSALFILILHNKLDTGAVVAKAISVPFVVGFQYWFNKNASFAVNHREMPWRQLIIFLVCTLSLSIFATIGSYNHFSDEYDNLLGAQMAAEHGQVIYRDYFSHHMPLTYFVAIPLFKLFGTNLVAIKTIFSMSCGIWLLAMSRHILKKFGTIFFSGLVLMITFSLVPNWANMLLAETLISYAVLHALILFLTRNPERNLYRELSTYAILGSIPVLAALPYAPLSVVIYAFGLYRIYEKRDSLSISRLSFPILLACVPYIAFASYLLINHAAGKFLWEAVTFNTKYYSQFTPDAASSMGDGFLAIPQGTLGSLYQSLTLHINHTQLAIPILFCSLTVLLGLYFLLRIRQWTALVSFGIVLFFAGARNGFQNLLGGTGDTRDSLVLYYAAIFLALYCLYTLRSHRVLHTEFSKLVTAITTTFLVISGVYVLNQTITGYRQAERFGALASVDPPIQRSSVAYIVNLINNPRDYYWDAPIDFGSQIHITSKNASIYRFYLPWHAACPSCTNQILSDIATKDPKVLAINLTGEIWGYKSKDFMHSIMSSIDSNYYQVKDPALSNFYFARDRKAEINHILQNNGYNISDKI